MPLTDAMQVCIFIVAVVLVISYFIAVIVSNRNYRKWSVLRTVSFLVGISLAVIAVVGPLAQAAHHDFHVHMIGHLLLGMLAPLLIVLSAPMMLFLRTIPTRYARKLTSFLKGPLPQFWLEPMTALIVNIGGLYILYTTNVYAKMHTVAEVYVLIHLHVFLAGVLFTATIIYIGPVFQRKSFFYRALTLLLAMALHSSLAKYLYAHPPVTVSDAQLGSMIMYYAGGGIDGILVFILCWQWYQATKPTALRSVNAE